MDLTSTVRPPRHANPADLPALAERDMLTVYAARRDIPPLAPMSVQLGGGQSVQVDGVSLAEDLFVVPICHQGALPADATAHLARDVFALSLVAEARPRAVAVLLFACEAAMRSARGLVGGLDADDLIALDVIDLGQEWSERLIEAVRPPGRHRSPAPGAPGASEAADASGTPGASDCGGGPGRSPSFE